MRFTRSYWCGILALALLLGACSSGPKKPPKTPDADAVPSEAASQRSPVLPEGPITPNPYLQNKPSVNRQAQQLFNDATAAMDKKQWPQAESLLVKLTGQFPTLSGAYLNLGIVYQAKGENDKAEQALNSALTVNPNNLDAYNQLAIFKREAGDFTGAEAQYQKALAVWPFHPESHKNLGILYDLYMGKSEQALHHYQAYQQLLPEPDKQMNGWIVDLERRLAAKGD